MIHLYELLYQLMQINGFPTKDIAPRIDPEGGEVHLYHFFETKIVNDILGGDYKNKIKDVVEQQKHTFIIGVSFIYKLYQDGLIYFPYESFEESKFDEWDVSFEKYPQPNFFYVMSDFCSKKIAKFLDSFLQSTICPSFQLLELCKHNFKTLEARRFFRSQLLGWVGVGVAITIAISSPWLMTNWSKSHIEDEQYDRLIEVIEKKQPYNAINSSIQDSININKHLHTNEQIKNAEP